MSRETRDWFGRAAQPVRERWRDKWEASSSAGEGGRPDVEARAGALLSQAVLRDPLPPHRLSAIAERLRRRPNRGPAVSARPLPRPVFRKMVVRVAAGLSLLVVGGALAATATHYFGLPFGFGRPSRSPSPAKRSVPGKIAHPPPSARAEEPELPAEVPSPPVVEAKGQEEKGPEGKEEKIDRRDVGRRDDGVTHRSLASLDRGRRASRLAPPSPSTSAPSSPSPLAQDSPPSEAPELAPGSPPPDPPLPREPAESPPLTSSPPPAPTPLAEESALVMSALAALRRHGDAAQALALLDQHDRRFPRGDLADEAALARVEALVKVKRSDEALAFLEARGPARRGGSQRKLVLTRAELRAAAGRCAASLDELDALLRGAPPADGVTERALWRRAACRASGGQFDLARADLESYLRLFPKGQFARAARAALDGDAGGLRWPER